MLAKAHGIPFYVAAPPDDLRPGDRRPATAIPIEERDPREVTDGFGQQTAPDGGRRLQPRLRRDAGALITGFFTDAGLLRPPFATSLEVLRG